MRAWQTNFRLTSPPWISESRPCGRLRLAAIESCIGNAPRLLAAISSGMRPHGNAQDLERRRRRAVHLKHQGHSTTQVARRVGATPQSVNRWWRAYRRGGEAGLEAKPTPEWPSRLGRRQQRDLAGRLLNGPKANGFCTEVCTCPRIANALTSCSSMKQAFSCTRWSDALGSRAVYSKSSIGRCTCPNLNRVGICDRSGSSVEPISTPKSHKMGRESFFFPSTKMQQVGARLEDELQAHLTALDQ